MGCFGNVRWFLPTQPEMSVCSHFSELEKPRPGGGLIAALAAVLHVFGLSGVSLFVSHRTAGSCGHRHLLIGPSFTPDTDASVILQPAAASLGPRGGGGGSGDGGPENLVPRLCRTPAARC